MRASFSMMIIPMIMIIMRMIIVMIVVMIMITITHRVMLSCIMSYYIIL